MLTDTATFCAHKIRAQVALGPARGVSALQGEAGPSTSAEPATAYTYSGRYIYSLRPKHEGFV